MYTTLGMRAKFFSSGSKPLLGGKYACQIIY